MPELIRQAATPFSYLSLVNATSRGKEQRADESARTVGLLLSRGKLNDLL
jgi:hypothetical protein